MNTRRNIILAGTVVLAGSALLAMAGGGGAGGGRGGGGGIAGPNRANGTNGAMSTLTKPTTPEKAPSSQGFLQRWLILDPITGVQGVSQSAVQASVKREFFPNQMTVIPKDGDKVTVNGSELTWRALDSSVYNMNLYHYAHIYNTSFANVLFWAVTVVNSPVEMHDVRLAVGSNDASVWWFNGQEVTGLYGDRPSIIDDGVSKRLTLKKGANIIRGAIHNQQGQVDFVVRLLDANDNPITNVTINLNMGGAGM